jgi:3-deoxy-D-manno-octulosonic-acid transferase
MYRRQGSLEGLGERFGRGWPRQDGAGRPVWLHGASVGEIKMLVPLVKAWQECYPETRLLLTTMTLTGREQARQVFPDAEVVLLPVDLSFLWILFFRHFKPIALIVAETELWPNLFNFCKRKKVPLALVNARLSRKSFVNYQLFHFFCRDMFTTPDLVVVQDQISGQRFAGLGTPAERIVFSGNLKFDLLPPAVNSVAADYRELFADNIRIMVAGSTHPGEEEMILAAWNKSVAEIPGMAGSSCLILAPRHPHRFAAVAELLDAQGADYLSFSTLKQELSICRLSRVPAVLLLDTLGDLIHFYRLADFAIIGGTLIPGIGGHNPLEAAVFARAVIHGVYVASFRDGFNFLDSQGGGLPVADEKELKSVITRCLCDSEFTRKEGRKARNTVAGNRGAVMRTLRALQSKLDQHIVSGMNI